MAKRVKNKDETNCNKLIDNVVKLMLRPEMYYAFVDSEGKRDMVSSMYPEKITFDEVDHRTPTAK